MSGFISTPAIAERARTQPTRQVRTGAAGLRGSVTVMLSPGATAPGCARVQWRRGQQHTGVAVDFRPAKRTLFSAV